MNHQNSSPNSRVDKKELVLRKGKRAANPLIIVIALAAIVAAVGVVYFITTQSGGSIPSVNATASGAQAGTTEIAYPLSLFADGKARYFEQKIGGLTVRYFIIQSTDGVVRAAFDACDVCWPAGKGYHQEGDVMVCNNCGRRFDSVLVNEVKGGCNPAPLKRTIRGEQLVILMEDIVQGQNYFNFKGRA
jgi:uncharacterized membrane protein